VGRVSRIIVPMDVLQFTPALTPSEASDMARRLYGIDAEASPLPSERDQNFLLLTAAGDRFVLKIANSADDRALLEAQNAALAHVARRITLCPRVVPGIDGALISETASASSVQHFVRLFSWLPGAPLGSVPDHSSELLEDLGGAVGELDTALDGFDHPAIHRDFYWDLARGLSLVRELAPLLEDPGMRALVTHVADQIEMRDAPRFARLRRAAVHNDPNDYNILVSVDLPPAFDGAQVREGGSHDPSPHTSAASAFRRKITGILDFGDIVHSYAIADLAIAIAYAVLGKPDPLAAAVSVLRGYQTARPLDDNEMAALFDLVLLRLCTSVCVAARQQKQRPGDAYLSVSQGPIGATLPTLAALDPEAVDAAFRRTCGKTPAETLAARRRVIGGNVSVAYRAPVKIVRGWMQYLYDSASRRYLDAYNNVPHVGHSHPRVVQAAIEQMGVLNTNTRYLHDNLARFAERLTATLPAPLRICYFVNSGSEANELALRLARAHTRRRDVIVLDAAYHGNTTTLVEISPYKFNGPGGEGAPPWVHVVPIPDTYRGEFRRDDPRAGVKYAAYVSRAIETMRAGGPGPSAFIAESAPSVGGQIVLPEGYLPAVYAAVRDAGGVCIADEVQTAYGRMGSHFYAFEAQRVVPDIVVLGKPIGNGYPLGAVVTTPKIAASFDNGMEFFSTFGGSTVSCAVGLAVLDVVQEERLQEHAREVGGALLDALRSLAGRHPLVGDVRGSGLFLGVELVKNRDTMEPATAEASDIVNRMRERGILLGTDGPFANVLKIRPPMPFTREDGDHLAATLDDVLIR
jgi:4-aminobutyrate aminotransferase-like enzyme/Ser/Thr protein kinase RdoA (MazF antagonist)